MLYLCVLVSVSHFLLLMPNSLCSHDPACICFLCFSDHTPCLLCKRLFCSPGLSSGFMDLLWASPWASSTFKVSALTCLLILCHGFAWILQLVKFKLQFYLVTYLLWPWVSYLTSLNYRCFLYKKILLCIIVKCFLLPGGTSNSTCLK